MSPRRPRSLFVALLGVLLGVLPLARSHSPGESSLVLVADAEALEVRFVLSLPAASALLPADVAPPLSGETFDKHRPALLAAVTTGCALLDADDAPIAPKRVLASFRDGHEVHFDFFFPPSARPARLRLPVLNTLGPHIRCEVYDLRAKPPGRGVLHAKSVEFALAAAP